MPGLALPDRLRRALAQQSAQAALPTLRLVALQTPRAGRIVGTPEHVPDAFERRERTGIDGFNVMLASSPSSLTDFVDGVVPIYSAVARCAPSPESAPCANRCCSAVRPQSAPARAKRVTRD